jgi:hypothetical protein
VAPKPHFSPHHHHLLEQKPPRNDAAADLAARLKSFHAAAKVWKCSHLSLPKFENNCKFMIDLLDLFEETRDLSTGEIGLCVLCRDTLVEMILARAARWKQRGKFRAVIEGDENTRVFHARAAAEHHPSHQPRRFHHRHARRQGCCAVWLLLHPPWTGARGSLGL